jgi:hypothetical protein
MNPTIERHNPRAWRRRIEGQFAGHTLSRRFAASCLMAALFLPLSLLAGDYSIDWFTIDTGGGSSTNGQYALTGTIGQPDAGSAMSSGNYSLPGGFWSLVSVVQTAGAPTLYIVRTGGGVTVYWQNVTGWTLEQSSSFNAAGGWSASSGLTTAGGTNSLSIILPVGSLFFKLRGS